MTKKKRRKRPGPLRPGASEPTARAGPPAGAAPTAARRGMAPRARGSRSPAPSRRPRTAEERKAAAAEWVHPPVAVTVARGLRTVGESPVLLISSFLAALALWLVFTAYGAHLARFPGIMSMLEALPPVHSLFLDISALVGGSTSSGIVALAFLAGLLAIRAALLGFWVSLIRSRLAEAPEQEGDRAAGWTGSVSGALRGSGRIFVAMVGMEAGFFALSMATAFVAVAFALGQFAVIAALVGGVYFFLYTPVIIAVEGVGVRDGARLSFRAARFPGPRHMVATFSYLVVALFISVFIPPSRVAAATPDLVTWLFVLFMSFVHISALATFTYRWLLIRDQVLAAAREGPARRPARASSWLR